MSKTDNSLVDPVAFMVAAHCKNDIAARQILRTMANTETGSAREAKTIVLKTLNIMNPQTREWVKGLYEKF